MKRRKETFDVYFLHHEVLETHLDIWVVKGHTAANTLVVQKWPSFFLLSAANFHSLEETNLYIFTNISCLVSNKPEINLKFRDVQKWNECVLCHIF